MYSAVLMHTALPASQDQLKGLLIIILSLSSDLQHPM